MKITKADQSQRVSGFPPILYIDTDIEFELTKEEVDTLTDDATRAVIKNLLSNIYPPVGLFVAIAVDGRIGQIKAGGGMNGVFVRTTHRDPGGDFSVFQVFPL